MPPGHVQALRSAAVRGALTVRDTAMRIEAVRLLWFLSGVLLDLVTEPAAVVLHGIEEPLALDGLVNVLDLFGDFCLALPQLALGFNHEAKILPLFDVPTAVMQVENLAYRPDCVFGPEHCINLIARALRHVQIHQLAGDVSLGDWSWAFDRLPK